MITFLGIIVYFICVGFSYVTLIERRYSEGKAFLMSLFFLPVAVFMIGLYTIEVLLPTFYKTLKIWIKQLML